MQRPPSTSAGSFDSHCTARAVGPLARVLCVQAYDCDASSIDSDNDGESVSKSVACSYDPEFKGFCTEPEEVEGVQAWTMSHFVAPLRTLGSCKIGPESPVCSSVPCKLSVSTTFTRM